MNVVVIRKHAGSAAVQSLRPCRAKAEHLRAAVPRFGRLGLQVLRPEKTSLSALADQIPQPAQRKAGIPTQFTPSHFQIGAIGTRRQHESLLSSLAFVFASNLETK